MKNVACSGIAIVLVLGLAGLPAGAQSQSTTTTQNSSSGTSSGTSLGAYARQVRKDPGTVSKPKVFDNDNLPKTDKLSVVGQTSATATVNSADAKTANSDQAAPAAGENKSSSDAKASGDKTASANKPAPLTADKAPAPEDEAARQAGAKQWSDKLTAQKDQIDLLTRELDVLQREYQIRAAAMYADAGNRMRNSADWDKQDTKYKQDIADKQKALDDAKQKQEDIQEEARKAGVSASVREP
jgi:hypothetical protein